MKPTEVRKKLDSTEGLLKHTDALFKLAISERNDYLRIIVGMAKDVRFGIIARKVLAKHGRDVDGRIRIPAEWQH